VSTLVVGRGLLGRQVIRSLHRRGDCVHTVDVDWHDPEAALGALSGASRAAARCNTAWRLAWCAGAGVVATSPEQLTAEVALFDDYLAQLDVPPAALFLASSAGGVYAGSPDRPPYDEVARTGAMAPYGHAKLAMEAAAARLAETGARVVLGRIANLYGPGQNLGKPQGLISQLCLTGLTRQPLGVYASLDTLRDYLYVDDAGAMVVASLDRVAAEPPGTVTAKILGSGQAVSIAELVGEVTRLFRRRPRLYTRPAPTQIPDLRLRSVIWPDIDALAATPLLNGLGATLEDVRSQLAAGELVAAVRSVTA
jgi:UDP-glucose 4-epimerase